MKKVVHIHSDHKFVSDTDKFEGEFFHNQVIILDGRHEHNQRFHDSALFFIPDKKGFPRILDVVNTADILVVDELDHFKSLVVLAAYKRVKIIWRFFGYELYFRKLHLYLDSETKAYCSSEIFKRKVQAQFPQLFTKESTFRSAIKRIDIMASVFEDEYNILKKTWPDLPKFVRIPLYSKDDEVTVSEDAFSGQKRNFVVLGNSRSVFNNHREVLSQIENARVTAGIEVQLLFNYGEVNSYSRHIAGKVKSMRHVDLVDGFIPYDQFIHFYDCISAFVNNSYRQHALGNIFQSLRSGVKVYLNQKNPTYKWMLSLGFKIYDVASLGHDLTHNNIRLSKEDAWHNLRVYQKVLVDYTKYDFQKGIMNLLNEPVRDRSDKKFKVIT